MKTKSNLALLTIVFFSSGLSSLVYQVSWQRILTLYYSVENISTTLIVSVYMMGLGLGAIVGGYLTDKIKNRLEVYLGIEMLIGLFGCVSIPFLEFLGRSTAGSNYLISFICMFAFLSLPTFLMGVTLPLLTKIFNDTINNFLRSLSYLYFINTLGAALGALISSYILISFFGLDTSIYVAAAINIGIVILIFIFRNAFSTIQKMENIDQKKEHQNSSSFSNHRIIYLIVFVTGFIAIGYEIIWFRIIGILVKASPYAFSSVLFIYLIGIALGSYFIKIYLSRNTSIDRKNLFFTFQFLIALFVIISILLYYYLVGNVDVFTTINSISFNNILHPSIKVPSVQSFGLFFKDCFLLVDVIVWPILFVLVPTLFMGASFPLITALAFRNDQEGATVGKVYFFNVLGNVSGGLFTGLILLGIVGTEYSILFLSFLGLLFIFFVKSSSRIFQFHVKILMTVSIVVLTIIFFPKKHQLYSIIHPNRIGEEKVITEGLDGVIVTYRHNEKLRTYINGMSHGGRPLPLFYYEAIEAISHQKQLKNVLVIGFGTGSTVETILKLNPKPKITLVELSETLIENLKQIDYLNTFLNDDSLDLIYADGRKYLYTHKEKYDAIFIDPLRTTTSFSNNLYSKQFFELIKQHLSWNGVFMVWMDEYHVVPKTLCSVFPYVKQYSFFCITSNSDLNENPEYKYDLLSRFPNYQNDLLRIDSAERNPLSRATILNNTIQYPINEDYKPRCEYFIGLKLY